MSCEKLKKLRFMQSNKIMQRESMGGGGSKCNRFLDFKLFFFCTKSTENEINQHLRPPVIKWDFSWMTTRLAIQIEKHAAEMSRYDCQVKFPFIQMFFACFSIIAICLKEPRDCQEISAPRTLQCREKWLRVSEWDHYVAT